MVVVRDGLFAILRKIVVVDVTAIHQRMDIVWPNTQCLIQILQRRPIILHAHIGIGSIIVGFGIVWVECECLCIGSNRFLTVPSIVFFVTALQEFICRFGVIG